MTIGWAVFGLGAALTIGGVVIDAVGTSQGTLSGQGGVGDNGNTDNTRNDFYFIGTTMLVAGLATAFYGGRHGLVGQPRRGLALERQRHELTDARNDVATKAAQAKLASAPQVSIPLLGATF